MMMMMMMMRVYKTRGSKMTSSCKSIKMLRLLCNKIAMLLLGNFTKQSQTNITIKQGMTDETVGLETATKHVKRRRKTDGRREIIPGPSRRNRK